MSPDFEEPIQQNLGRMKRIGVGMILKTEKLSSIVRGPGLGLGSRLQFAPGGVGQAVELRHLHGIAQN